MVAVRAAAPPMTDSHRAVVRVVGLERVYGDGDVAVRALRGVNLTVQAGEYVAIMGPSGCGKSTLLNVLGCLDRPTAGTYELDGLDASDLDPDARAAVRSERLGFVFQDFHLLPRTTALENVELPLLYGRTPPAEQRRLAIEALSRVGLGDRAAHTPRELSGGQQQRVAIARALVTEPALLLADEPTGNLDSETGAGVLALLDELHGKGLTIVLVTHDPDVGARADRIVRMRDGRVVEGAS